MFKSKWIFCLLFLLPLFVEGKVLIDVSDYKNSVDSVELRKELEYVANSPDDYPHVYTWQEILFGRESSERATCENEEDEGSPLDEFPEIFTEEQLAQGAIILHIFGAIYFFTLLTVVCNDYFLPTVECICEDLHLSKDVAAATFMASATTMPEFFTNTISTLITNNDMGVGTIIGSLMFNTLGVAAIAGMSLDKPIQLDWWPVVRDCTIYSFNTVILIIITWNSQITFWDTLVLTIFLIVYYTITFNNNRFMNTIRVFVEDKMNCCLSTRYDLTKPVDSSARGKLPLTVSQQDLKGHGVFVVSEEVGSSASSTVSSDIPIKKEFYQDDDAVSETSEYKDDLFQLPRGQSCVMKFWWAYSFPIKFVLRFLIPNPQKIRKLYPLTFIMCIVCIGINAFMIVWMLTALGVVIHCPDIVMGLTFLAAGSATPEAVSSAISVRKGDSGIGVSNSLGANSLAILLSLGLPWFIKNCITFNSEVNYITLNSQSIRFSVGILLVATLALFTILNFFHFRLSRKVGLALFSIYAILITLQILIEMNVFFPKKC